MASMTVVRCVKSLLLALGFTVPVLAQQVVDTRRAAAPDGRVEIENLAGSIRVIGWDREEVQVKGTLGAGAEGLDFSGNRNRTHVEVDASNPHGVNSDLEIHVPAGSRVSISSFSAGITASDVTGTIQAESVDGSISVTGAPKEVELETVSGRITVTGVTTRTKADAVNGGVTLTNVRGEIEATSINGRVRATGCVLSRGHFETVSGGLEIEGELAGKGGNVDLESVSGNIELTLPASAAADFSVSTFSGSIHNELGPEGKRTSRYTSEQDLQFSTGGGGTAISIKTLSGAIALHKK